jgi:spore maturation protein SpmB
MQSSIGLRPQRDFVTDIGRTVFVHASVDSTTLTAVLVRLRTLGFSIGVLCDAANTLATAAQNRPLPRDAVFLHDRTMYALSVCSLLFIHAEDMHG